MSSTWLISSVPIPWSRSRYGFPFGPRKLMLWNRYCIIVRISPNWPPSPSCRALAAAGSGSSASISLISRCTCRYMRPPRRSRVAVLRGGADVSPAAPPARGWCRPVRAAGGGAGPTDVLRGVRGVGAQVLSGRPALVLQRRAGLGRPVLDRRRSLLRGLAQVLGDALGGVLRLLDQRCGLLLRRLRELLLLARAGQQGRGEPADAEGDQAGGERVAPRPCPRRRSAGSTPCRRPRTRRSRRTVGAVGDAAHDALLDVGGGGADAVRLALGRLGGADLVGQGVHVRAQLGARALDVVADLVRVGAHRFFSS